MRARPFASPHRLLRALAGVCLLVLAGIGGCGLSTQGQPPDGQSKPCSEDLGCVTGDLCKIGSCGPEGYCVEKPVPDGEPAMQVPGDCKRVTCAAGVTTEEPDPTDNDDSNPCTADSCEGSVATHEKLSNVQCGQGGACRDGVCVIACASASDDCEDDNPCTKGSCDLAAGQCVQEPTHGALVENASGSDCVEVRCSGDTPTTVPNDAEIPDDGNDCTNDVCTGGVASSSPAPPHTPCASGVCNNASQCVGCNNPSTCSGVDNDCQTRTCFASVCGFDYAPAGAPVIAQVAGDCKITVCDGAGGTMVLPDNSDVPPEDGLPCTDQVCAGGVPSFPPKPINTPCPGGVCNAAGVCVECNAAAQCPAGPCRAAVCNGNQCGATNIPANTDPNNDCADQGAASCGNDGMCDGNGACRRYPAGTVCGPGSCSGGAQTNPDTCDGAGACTDGGTTPCAPYVCGATACKTSCANGADCDAQSYCNPMTSHCEPKLALGSQCTSAPSCASGFCTDGVCCNAACNGLCRSCAIPGHVGTCTNHPDGSDPEGCPMALECCSGSCGDCD